MQNKPKWLSKDENGRTKIIEYYLAEELQELYGNLWCVHGQFYNHEGFVPDEKIRSLIHGLIRPYFFGNLATRTKNVIDALRDELYTDPPKPDPTKVYFNNGYFDLKEKTFVEQYNRKEWKFVLHRLKAGYHPEAPGPERFLEYLNDLLYPEDIPTLQEFMGYCMIPSTAAEKMLFLIGDGGEGKSVLGSVLRCIFGDAMISGNLLETFGSGNSHATCSLENKLLFLDDDISLQGFRETSVLKTVVTAKQPILVNPKNRPQYEIDVYSRIMAFGNGSPQFLFDRSDGAYRRQLLLETKPKEDGRLDDPTLPAKLKLERDAIVVWMIEGLKRLAENNWRLTISDRAKRNLELARKENCNFYLFLEDEDWIVFDPAGEETFSDIYAMYLRWAYENGFGEIAKRSVGLELTRLAKKPNGKIKKSNHIKDKLLKKELRGYYGLRLIRRPYGTNSETHFSRVEPMCGQIRDIGALRDTKEGLKKPHK